MLESVSALTVRNIADAAGFAVPGLGPRVSASTLTSVWQRALRETGDDAMPVRVARRTRLADLGIFGFALLTAPTVRESLRAAIELFPVINGLGTWSTNPGDETVQLQWRSRLADPIARGLSTESVIAHFVAGVRELVCRKNISLRVELAHAPRRPSLISEHCGCEVAVATGMTTIEIGGGDLDAPPPHAHQAMHRHFVAACRDELQTSRPATDPGDEVDAIIARLLGDGDASADNVAAELGITRRTLHRRLVARGSSFRDRKDQVRRRLARRWADGGGASVTQLALDLGFADLSSLSRAYRRWFGEVPSRSRC